MVWGKKRREQESWRKEEDIDISTGLPLLLLVPRNAIRRRGGPKTKLSQARTRLHVRPETSQGATAGSTAGASCHVRYDCGHPSATPYPGLRNPTMCHCRQTSRKACQPTPRKRVASAITPAVVRRTQTHAPFWKPWMRDGARHPTPSVLSARLLVLVATRTDT